ncbi:O-antigen ligase [Haloarcula sp. CBA1127]|uniref:O-antigen ligase family protein n=1 Tax=Haloarcula sp. CBA1127 TaxID=1765055 RepID=UPI00073E6F81|nr:O-antigen ligase family protein [Haloarcula sp. CBA1127]
MEASKKTDLFTEDFDTVDILVLCMVFFLPFAGYAIPTGIVFVSPTNLLILTATTVLTIRQLLRAEISWFSLLYLVIILFVTFLLYNLLAQAISGGSYRRIITQVGYLMLVVSLLLYVDSWKRLHTVLSAVFLSSLAISVIGIVSSLTGVFFGGEFLPSRSIASYIIPFTRTSGIELSHGEIGMFTLGSLPYVVFRSKRSGQYLPFVGVAVILFYIVFILQSRSTWGALLAMVYVVFYLYPVRNRSVRTPVALLRLAGIVLLPLAIVFVFHLFTGLESGGGSLAHRLSQLKVSYRLISENILTGVGWGNIRQHFFRNRLPHNAFLIIGVGAGIPAIAFVIGVITTTCGFLVRLISGSKLIEHRLLALALLTSMTAVVVEANFLVGFGKAGWMWVGIALAFIDLQQRASVTAPQYQSDDQRHGRRSEGDDQNNIY